MLDRFQLEAFAAVAELGSFEKAANALHITRGAVSQRIKALEETLSTVLLLRERPVLPTGVGEILLRHVKAVRLLEHDVYASLRSDTRRHERMPIAIAVNADSLDTWFDGCSGSLLQRLPVALEIIVDDQDHTTPMLTRGEVTGCISTVPKAARGFEAIALGSMEYRCFAAPAFAHRYFPNGLTVHGIETVPAVIFNRKDSLHDTFVKTVFGIELNKGPRHYFPSPAALLYAIVGGNGYGLVPLRQARALIEAGRLVDLMPDLGLSIPLFWHHWREEPPLSRKLTGLVVDCAREALAPPDDECTGTQEREDAGDFHIGPFST